MPPRSARVPIIRPGTSCRNTSGRLNVSHRSTNLVSLASAAGSSAPAADSGWLATMPTGWPSIRASAVIRLGPQRAAQGKSESRSAIASSTRRMS